MASNIPITIYTFDIQTSILPWDRIVTGAANPRLSELLSMYLPQTSAMVDVDAG